MATMRNSHSYMRSQVFGIRSFQGLVEDVSAICGQRVRVEIAGLVAAHSSQLPSTFYAPRLPHQVECSTPGSQKMLKRK